MNWTDCRTEKLKTQWQAGLPAAAIATAIGGGCTKNMVIGKANRLGLPQREKRAAMTAWWRHVGKPKWKAKHA